MNAVFVQSVACEIGKLCKEKCRGCEVNHPSQRRHECTYTYTYIHRLYLKHGKPSVILHNKYSLNYSKLKNIWIHIVYIYINITNMKLLFYQVAVWESDKS